MFWLEDINEYDDMGNPVLDKSVHYDEMTQEVQSVNGIKNQYTYNPDSTVSESIFFRYDFGSDQWIPTFKYAYEYGQDRKMSLAVTQEWDTATAGWQNFMRSYRNYDPSGKFISGLSEEWDDQANKWVKHERITDEYDASGYLSMELRELWDTAALQWVNSSKDLRQYLDETTLQRKEVLNWNIDSSFWWRSVLEEYTYDEFKNLLYFYRERWKSAWELSVASKREYINDYAFNTITLKAYTLKNDEWIPQSLIKNVYAAEEGLDIVDLVYQDEEICVVTVSPDNRNLLVWEKTDGVGTIAYNIYREGDVADQYDLIGTQPFESFSIFTDEDSDPREQAYRYKIACVDFCGESALSNYHQTIHLQINPGNGLYNLNWSKYEYEGGPLTFVTHEILRGSSPGDMNQIGSVSGNIYSYTDINPPGDTLYYQIRGILATPCYPGGILKSADESYQYSLSNVDDNRQALGVETHAAGFQLCVYPNPATEAATIIIPDPGRGSCHIYLRDLTGKIVRVIEDVSGDSYLLSRMGLPAGFYMVELKGGNSYTGKLVLQ
jgi:hypothetical protein